MSFNRTTYQTIPTQQYTQLRNAAEQAARLQREAERLRRQAADAKAQASAAQTRNRTLEQNIAQLDRSIAQLQLSNTELRNAVEQSNQRIRSAQAAHERSMTDMRTQMRAELDSAQRANANRMQSVQDALTRDLRQSESQLRSHLHQAIEQNNEQLHQAMNANAQRINSRITAVATEMNSRIAAVQANVDTVTAFMDALSHSSEALLQQSSELLEVSRAIIAGARSFCESHHHAWRSEEFTALQTADANVAQDIKTGISAAASARSGARDLFAAALALREQVTSDEMAWQSQLLAASEMLTEAEITLEANRTLPNGNEPINVDYWSNGDLSNREAHLRAMREQLEDPQITTEQMASIRQLAEQCIREIPETAQYAAAANQRSVDRRDLLNRAEEHLRERFYSTSWSDYHGGDDRLGYRVLMENDDGAVICLTADVVVQGGEVVNRFTSDIQRLPANMHSAREADQFNAAILAALNCDGLLFTAPDCTNTTAPVEDETQTNHDNWVHIPEQTHTEQLADRATPPHAAAKPVDTHTN